jgi:polyphosphate kinase
MVEALTTLATLRRLLPLLAVLAFPSDGFSHRLDEYLQATLVAIEPDHIRLQINLTPGVDVAQQVLGKIDRDKDSAISKSEAASYAELLRRDLTLRLDGRKLKLKLTASQFPPPVELRTGLGIIQLEFSVKLGPLATGAHKLVLENRHLPSLSVYLLNAAQPKAPTIRITGQKRTDNQHAGEIEFNLSANGAP